MRILAYNILEGLRPVDPPPTERRKLDRARTAAAQAVVREADPDFLVLNEALFCQQYGGRRIDYGALFGFEFAAAALYDEAWGNAILSRYPIQTAYEVRTQERGGLVSRVRTPSGELVVASYHPHPARDAVLRAEDFARLVEGTAGPTLVCGDFNCLNPDDAIDLEALVDGFRQFSVDAEASVQRFVEAGRHVFPTLAARGLYDAVPEAGRRYTIPTDLVRSDKRSAMRIDHILCNDGIRVEGGEVVHSEASNRASDHHPVQLDFTLHPT